MTSIRPLVPLLLAAGILLGGNGVQSTLLALRGAREGFEPAIIGWVGTSYFAGFLLGCLFITRIMKSVGYIRAFSALAAIAAAATLLMVMVITPAAWITFRFASGFCFAGLFTIMEAWLNSGATNETRARVLAVYRIIDLGSVTGAQFLVPAFGVEGFEIFAVMAIMISLSLVPVSLGDRTNPAPPEQVRLDLRRAWRISPLASIGCIAVGMTNSAFRTMSPVYAEQIGLSVGDIVIFVSLSIVGGALIQYPLGHVSDKWDRRTVLLIAAAGSAATAVALMFAGGDPWTNYALGFVFGSFAMPLYSLSAAHANDRAGKGEFVLVNAALMLFYSVGAVGGPTIASYAMESYGPHALFGFSALVYLALILVTLYRMSIRPAAPESHRTRFVALLRTSPLFARLARRNGPTRGAEAAPEPLDEAPRG